MLSLGQYKNMFRSSCGHHLHRNPNCSIRSIPEPDITCVLASSGRIPRHDDEVELDADVEDNDRVPGFELWFGQVRFAPAPAHDVDAQRHGEVEKGFGHDCEVIDLRRASVLAASYKRRFSIFRGYTPNVNASPAGTATIINAVKPQITAYGPKGVPKG
jgi:hypothetical protein